MPILKVHEYHMVSDPHSSKQSKNKGEPMTPLFQEIGNPLSLTAYVKKCASDLEQYAKGKDGLGEPFLAGFSLDGRVISFGIGGCFGENARMEEVRTRLFLIATHTVRTLAFCECWAVSRPSNDLSGPPPSQCQDRQELLVCFAQDIGSEPITCAFSIVRDSSKKIAAFRLIDFFAAPALREPLTLLSTSVKISDFIKSL